jgi:putative N6-adenine-specific DNA methylase
MCGSGTFVIEAAEIAIGVAPGRRRDFSFQKLKSFDLKAFKTILKDQKLIPRLELNLFGYDRDNGAIKNSIKNAELANVSHITNFESQSISDLSPLSNQCGLVIFNPPYGGRIGDKKILYALYAKIGMVLKSKFNGWRVGLITADGSLAKTTQIKFSFVSEPINHGGLKVRCYYATL